VKVVAAAETLPGERRVAIVPDTVVLLSRAGHEVSVQTGAGAAAGWDDDPYAVAGATVVTSRDPLLSSADVVLSVQPPPDRDTTVLRAGTVWISYLFPKQHPGEVRALAERGVTSFGVDLVPRISRAQGMDALSSQALISGYHAAVVAAARLPKFFPMSMTAAGTVPPAKVLVLGTGVAGLQAIATARRLGAVVSAYDVRAAAAEEVRSLGAMFLDLGLETQEGEGGYARAQSEEFLARQRQLLGEQLRGFDVVITTAVVPGRPAPRLITTEMLANMRRGSLVVDLAADAGGNCEVTRAGEEVEHGGVWVIGVTNPASALPQPASMLYARNLANLLEHLVTDGAFAPDWTDEIVIGCCVTREGKVLQ
jgi:NAD(P) transhydrogenase subunit alpha